METIDFIMSYLRENASPLELSQVATIVSNKQYKHPPLEESIVLERLIEKCKQLRQPVFGQEGLGKLACVKYIKDVTGWGLKDSKDWFDNVVEQNH